MNTANEIFISLYWEQIFRLKTSLKVKWMAIRGLWIMHKMNKQNEKHLDPMERLEKNIRHLAWTIVVLIIVVMLFAGMCVVGMTAHAIHNKKMVRDIQQIFNNRIMLDDVRGCDLQEDMR